MRKFLVLGLMALLLAVGLVAAEIPRTHVSSRDLIEANVDGKQVLFGLRENLGMSYKEHYYARRGDTIDSGRLALTIKGATALTGSGRRGDKPIYSRFSMRGKAVALEVLDVCRTSVDYVGNSGIVKHGRERFSILKAPIANVIHNKCANTVTINVNHPEIQITNAVFSV